jgi:hypothetical protein
MPLGDQSLTNVSRQQAITAPGMAYFAGTGPRGETCGKCLYWKYRYLTANGAVARSNGCRKYYEMMNSKKGPDILPNLAACKYFQQIDNKPRR